MSYNRYLHKGFSPDYYHAKLSSTNSASWAKGDYFKKRDDGSPGSAKCAMGQLGVRYSMTPSDYTDEQQGMIDLFRHYLDVEVHHINDGLDVTYNYIDPDEEEGFIPSPKQRILGALRIAQDIHNVEQLLLEDKRKVRILLSYLHRNPCSFDFGEYVVTKTADVSTNLLYK